LRKGFCRCVGAKVICCLQPEVVYLVDSVVVGWVGGTVVEHKPVISCEAVIFESEHHEVTEISVFICPVNDNLKCVTSPTQVVCLAGIHQIFVVIVAFLLELIDDRVLLVAAEFDLLRHEVVSCDSSIVFHVRDQNFAST